MDWVALGAIATVALVGTGAWQALRSGRKSDNSIGQAPAEIPVLEYRVDLGDGSYVFPENWKVDLPDERWANHQNIERDLIDINFGVIRIYNTNDFVVRRIALELGVHRAWSVKIMSTRTLSRNAIGVSIANDSISITIDELPPKEEIRIAVISGGSVHSNLTTKNASVKLKSRGIWDA